MTSIQNRIIVTEKGQELQRSIGEDVKQEQQHLERLKKEEEQKNQSLNDESRMLMQSVFNSNSSLRMMESMSKKFQIVQNNGRQSHQKIIDMLVEENKYSKADLSPYMLSQINKMTEEIIKPNPKNNQSKSVSNLHSISQTIDNSMNFNHPQRIGYNNQKQNNQQSISTPQTQMNLHNSSGIMNQSMIDDSSIADKCNAILHCEARVDRIMKRYKKYQQVSQQVEAKVKRSCELKREEIAEINLKPPKKLEELRQENEQIAEILNREDKSVQNKKVRILDTMKKKYKKVWKISHIPELTEKYKLIHKMHFQHIEEEEEQEEEIARSISPNGKNFLKNLAN